MTWLVRRWRALRGWERAVWCVAAALVALGAAFPWLLRALRPDLAVERAAIAYDWRSWAQRVDPEARDPWGRPWRVEWSGPARGFDLLSTGPDGVDEDGRGDDVRLTGAEPVGRAFFLVQVRWLPVVAATVLLLLVHGPWVRWPRTDRWYKELGLTALTTLTILPICLKAVLLAVLVPFGALGGGERLVESPHLLISADAATLLSAGLGVTLLATLARLTLRGDPRPADQGPAASS